jgi:hypothetical protein
MPYQILVGKPEVKNQIGVIKHRHVDNIQIDLKEIGCESVDWGHWLKIASSGGLL